MPLIHLLAGPNAAGKTTFYEEVLAPATGLPFINAYRIARERFAGKELKRAYDAAKIASAKRKEAMLAGRSFVTETVFSHPSKLGLVREAKQQNYEVVLHVMIVPLALAVARAELRASQGGHQVPPSKVRSRYHRLWPLVVSAIEVADEAVVYDNTRAARPFDIVARYIRGALVGDTRWPPWSPLGDR